MKNTTESYSSKVSEDCAKQLGNIYKVPLVAALRFRQLNSGQAAKVITKSGKKFTALEEIEAGVVR